MAAQHGEELFGLKVIGRLNRLGASEVLTIVANPEAIAKRRRFLDTDLNRSYASNEKSREVETAKLIKAQINDFDPSYVIDIHTSHMAVGKTAIVAHYSECIEALSQALGMETIVIMPKEIADNSLIGCFAEKSVSIELGMGLRSDKLAEELCRNIYNLQNQPKITKKQLPRFLVTKTIPKTFKSLKKVVNLEFNKELKAYPFLAGESAYHDIGGFMAKKLN